MVFILSDWSIQYISSSTSLYLIIVLPLLLYTQVFLRVHLLALYFSPCILSLCLPLLTHTLSYTIHLLMTYNYRCLPPDKIFKLLHFMQSCKGDFKALATANIMTTMQNSCLSPPKELSISITYLIQSRSAMLKFPSKSMQIIWALH